MDKPATLTCETILGAKGPCRAYSGMAAAIKTRAGIEVVLLCAETEHLVQLIGKINPGQTVDPKGFYPVSLIHDRHITRQPDGDEL